MWRRTNNRKLIIIIAVACWALLLSFTHNTIVRVGNSGNSNEIYEGFGWKPQTLFGGSVSFRPNPKNYDAASLVPLCKGGILNYSKDGSSYKCIMMAHESKEANNNETQFHDSVHDRLPSKGILLLNQPIGSVTRICEVSAISHNRGNKNEVDNGSRNKDIFLSQCVLPTGNETKNINSPMPVHTKQWMRSQYFQDSSIIVYYSSHHDKSMSLLALDKSTKMWKKLTDVTLKFEPKICRTLHSPSILVDDREKMFYM